MGGQCWTKDHRPKKRYLRRADAKRARRHYIAEFGTDPGQPYHCEDCDYFHLGHYPTSPAVRARLRDRHRRGTTA